MKEYIKKGFGFGIGYTLAGALLYALAGTIREITKSEKDQKENSTNKGGA